MYPLSRMVKFYVKRFRRRLRIAYHVLQRLFTTGKPPLRLERRDVLFSRGVRYLNGNVVKPTTIIAYIYEYYYYDGRSWVYSGVTKETVLVCQVGKYIYYPVRYQNTNDVENLIGYYLDYLGCQTAPR